MTASPDANNKVHNRLTAFAAAYAKSGSYVSDLFLPGGSRRDFLAFGWTMGTHEGQASIAHLAYERAATSITDITVHAAPGADEVFLHSKPPPGPQKSICALTVKNA